MNTLPKADFRQTLARYELSLPESQIERLERYCELLWDWNQRLNLTRHTDWDKFVSRDLLDTIQLSQLLSADERVLDVGTGGGVPGVVLAILRPDLHVSLCESVAKKTRAVASILRHLGLPLTIHEARAEHLLDDYSFDTLVARAVGPLWKICTWFKGRWHEFDRLLAIKGPGWVEERGQARHRGLMHEVELRKLASYPMPGTDSESVILQLRAKPSRGRLPSTNAQRKMGKDDQ